MTEQLVRYYQELAQLRPEYAEVATKQIAEIQELVKRNELPDSFGSEVLLYEAQKPCCGSVCVHRAEMYMHSGENKIQLTKTEGDILSVLKQNAGNPMTRAQIIQGVHGTQYLTHRGVDVHLSRVRIKIKQISPEYDPLETLRGHGYKFKDSNAEDSSSDIS